MTASAGRHSLEASHGHLHREIMFLGRRARTLSGSVCVTVGMGISRLAPVRLGDALASRNAAPHIYWNRAEALEGLEESGP